MESWSTQALSRLNEIFTVAAWILALLTAVATAGGWFTGRQLDRRRTVESDRLRNTAERAQAEALTLRRRLAPREVTPEQRAAVVTGLRQTRGALHVVYVSDPEAQAFAEQLVGIFEEAGWTTDSEGAMSFGPVVGLRFDVKDPDALPPQVPIIRQALSVLQRDIPARRNTSTPDDGVILVVGSKRAD